MKITGSSKIQSLILTAALSIGFGFVSPVFAQSSSYYILDTKLDTKLRTLGGVASEMNDAGQVVGWRSYGNAFITGPDGVGMRDLGTLGGEWSFGYAINAIGQGVGASKTATGEEDVFITGPNGVGMTDLNFNSLGGGDYSYSEASGINDAGQVVGYTYTSADDVNAFITGPDGVGMRDLRTLGGSNSIADDINDAGQVVGSSGTATGEGHAFITGPNGVGMTDLNSLVGLPAGFVITRALDINNAGQVLINAIIPEPQSYALMLTGLILVGFMAWRKRLLA